METFLPSKSSRVGTRSIGMWLDTYDDIFSDFDPRPYSERAVSDDFLNEARKMFRENPKGKFELRILIPKKLRSFEEEVVVGKRLKSYFKSVESLQHGKTIRAGRMGGFLAISGFLLLFLAVFVARMGVSPLLSSSLLIVLEPAGWFTVWFGMDQLFYTVPENKKNLLFYKKMARAEILFESY